MEMNVPTYVNPYWNYSEYSENMDFTYIEDHDVYLFHEVEEYSVFMAGLIQKRYPGKTVVFFDAHAELFPGFQTAGSKEEYLNEHPEFKTEKLLSIGSNMDIGPVVKDTHLSLSAMLMASVFWASEISSFGDKNPDKTFYLIKPEIGESGLAKFIEFTIGFYNFARNSQFDLIPVVDTGIMGDDNQFSNGNGADVWEMFFEPLSPYPLQEVYESRVIVSQEGNTSVKPYLLAIKRNPNVSPMIGKYVKLNEKAEQYAEKICRETLTDHPGRVLGVVGRGTDFNHPVIVKYRQKPLDPLGLLEKVKERFHGGGFDRIFLATEDQRVYDTFMQSEIAPYVCAVPQQRFNISQGSDQVKLLADIYKENKETRNGYEETIRYLAILYTLSRCDAMIASTECGATIFAEGYKKTDFEFADIYGKQNRA